MTLMTSSLSFCTTLYFYMFVVIGLHSHVTWGHTNNREFKREREREDGRVSKREEERERRKSHHITRRTRGKVVIRIALIPPHTSTRPLKASLSGGSGNAFPLWNRSAARMEWNEVDLVQEFTVEGQCSKIKVRSCRITWDSLQVNTSAAGTS